MARIRDTTVGNNSAMTGNSNAVGASNNAFALMEILH